SLVHGKSARHHPCEEQMFALLASKSPDSRAVVTKLTREHELSQRTGQELLALLGEVSVDDQSQESRVNLADALKDFAFNMRAHIKEEEKLLYSEAWRLFTSDDWKTVSYEEPGDDPLSDAAHLDYPLLSDYVSGKLGQSQSQVFHDASSCADRITRLHKLASRQRKEAYKLTIESISSMPPVSRWRQSLVESTEIMGANEALVR
ncbi:hemerythrin domain-containing protein, partial [Pseudomonadota bacterium]